MKIGIVTGILYPYAQSGPAIVMYNLANQLAKRNVEVTIFGAIPPNETIKISEYYPNIKLKLHGEKNVLSLLLSSFIYLKQINDADLDILHFESLPGARGFLIMPFLHLLNNDIKLVQKIHGWPPIELAFRFDNYFQRQLYKIHWEVSKINIHKYCESIIVNSIFMRDIVKNEFSKYIEVIPNGVNLNLWKFTPGINLDGDANIVFWGRFSNEKGVDLIVESAQSVLKEFPNTHFYLIGDGPLFNSINQQLEKFSLRGNIHLLSFLPHQELIKYASSAKVTIFPSRYEPFGMMILEAMALKKPIVSTNVGGIKEIIQNYENGILVNPDSNELSKTVIELISNEVLCDTLSTKAYEISKKYDWDKISENYINYYETILGELK